MELPIWWITKPQEVEIKLKGIPGLFDNVIREYVADSTLLLQNLKKICIYTIMLMGELL